MALKLVQRLSLGIRPGTVSCAAQPVCVACVCTSTGRCILTGGCRRLRLSRSSGSLTSVVREPSFVGPRGESVPRFRLTQQHGPVAEEEERHFRSRLSSCLSSAKVFKLLRSTSMVSEDVAVAVLHRVSDLERDEENRSLRDPSVLDDDAIRVLCLQLERDSGLLSDSALVSALLACTRLYLDPWSTLMVRLISESQKRLDSSGLSVDQLCILGQAMLAIEGPEGAVLEEVMTQIQNVKPSRWSLDELSSVYRLLQTGVAHGGKYRDLLNAMHSHAVTVTSSMDEAAVSGLLGALVDLNQTQVVPLVIQLCKRAVRHVPRFTDEQLATVLAALMHFGHSDRYLVEAVERRVTTTAFTCHAEMLTKATQFLGRRNILSPPVLDAVAESFVYRADTYSTGQVARQIAPFGKLAYLPPNAGELFRKIEGILSTRFSQFQPHTLLDLLHSCILVERFPVNFVSKVFRNFFLQQLQEEATVNDRFILAQLTQLYMTIKLECPFYEGPQLPPKYRVKSFLIPGRSLETPVDQQLYNSVKSGLVDLLGARSYFSSKVLTPYCYTLDVEIKLDEEGYVLPASHDDVFKRIALCIDGQSRFTINDRRLLGSEGIKQRHLKRLGYEVVQIPFSEFNKLHSKDSVMNYLHQKIFPHSYRLNW
ncbi:FAST kinase domain-containing protein 3, mitochondrial [Corythoichthys intestinalis]|uniref:FAST kinase domain-containing protein 3, mitochondrial n=1 Tax=Corythoichthys intestinalis TaxID=161448 RepID=UPI0025A6899E|nr:FAST kinase domain-containing protein 3, mitochondrial [Corythoichthys intestinalis]XP_061809961.1 FAST kinase domain-containing protein 3, mitochondrial-like [Nerophis lumbriciformis]